MSDANRRTDPKNSLQEALPNWEECDLFCIHDYAGTTSVPCGWRGCLHDLKPGDGNRPLVCPRCGATTLLRIPSAHRPDHTTAANPPALAPWAGEIGLIHRSRRGDGGA